ncbi:hypothetical protein [Citrobacter portucalensis]|uniref:Uncharacterized protein n=1 Tax=Citrobacter portucalensis TaxID=1639133 RepID=A0AAW9ETQ1_9ENTR|nr:hypothetical protein [Citrobacter portucalensis]MDX7149472.1 hypothetical protein [Citrobacter portucalensis]
MENITGEYFLDTDDELVDYLEKQGEECIKEAYHSNTVNIENGYKLLNIQIVGIGSSFLLLTQKTNWDYLAVGIAAFTFLWTWCAIYLVHSGLSVNVRALISAPPDSLYTKSFKSIDSDDHQWFRGNGYTGTEKTLPIIRRYRLADLCKTSKEMLVLNKRIRTHLDRARIMTILAPVVSILASAIAFCYL